MHQPVFGFLNPPAYTVIITGSINLSYTTNANIGGSVDGYNLPRGGSIKVEVKCPHNSSAIGYCSRTGSGTIEKVCPKPLPNVEGRCYYYYESNRNEWKAMCYVSVTKKTGSETPHDQNCRVWFYTNEELTNSFGDGYSPSGSWDMTVPSSWYGNTIYVKVIPGDGCGPAATEHYWVGRATITPLQAGTFYFTWTEVCR